MTRLYRRLPRHEKAGFRLSRAAPFILAGMLVGCGSIEIPMPGDRLAGAAMDGHRPPTLPDSLDASDAEVLRAFSARLFVETDDDDADVSDDLRWHNADTGSMGTILPVSGRRRRRSDDCRDFSSTVTSVSGIHRYAATSCMTLSGDVVLRSISGAE